MSYSHDFFRILFRNDNFPKDYFTFVLRLMQLLKAFTPIRQLKLEIEKVGTPLPVGSTRTLVALLLVITPSEDT
jgi:hypothetical protein